MRFVVGSAQEGDYKLGNESCGCGIHICSAK